MAGGAPFGESFAAGLGLGLAAALAATAWGAASAGRAQRASIARKSRRTDGPFGDFGDVRRLAVQGINEAGELKVRRLGSFEHREMSEPRQYFDARADNPVAEKNRTIGWGHDVALADEQ